MWKETDDKVAVAIIDEVKQRFPRITQCSFDKGYYSKKNVSELNKRLDRVILPKKGRCNEEEKKWEDSEIFRQARRQHSAVESCINHLEVRGFERHVALSIVATNIHRIGLLQQRAEKARLIKAERRKKRPLAA